jgi:nucleotidyltransferase/DNA polymerase involved in DNA repair
MPLEVAERIRADIFQQTGFTASAGVAPNKFLPKLPQIGINPMAFASLNRPKFNILSMIYP